MMGPPKASAMASTKPMSKATAMFNFMLSEATYDRWKEMEITFDPHVR
jgi:hypothetical protein